MRWTALMATAALLASGCGDGNPGSADQAEPEASPAEAENSGSASGGEPRRWDLERSGDGVGLALLSAPDTAAVRLICPAGENRLLVNVPAFRPIGSEERMSFGSNGAVVTLVADTSGDQQRGGVSGTGAVPDNLAAIISGGVSVNYGAQDSGPHPPPPDQLVRAFVAACAGSDAQVAAPAPPREVSACLMQDGSRIPANRLRAVGTEPFWGARIEGRCVTYSHPEDQAGTRVWTRFTGSSERGEWSGYLSDQRFVLRTRPQPGCSDGMSDTRYPIAVTLTVRGEQRSGCAEPL